MGDKERAISLINCCLPMKDRGQLAPPQGLLAISGVLRRDGFGFTLSNSAEVVPADQFNSTALANLIVGQSHGIVGLSVWDSTLPFVVAAIRLAKEQKPDLFVILGGPAASTVGPRVIEEFPWIDCIVTGEGETGLPPVLSFLFGKVCYPPEVVTSKVYLRWQGNVVTGKGPRARLKGYEIVSPDYTLFDFSNCGRFEVSTSRGCVHNCRYCSVNSAWGKGIRFRPMASVIDEIDRIHDATGADLIHVLDDSFLTSPRRVRAFCGGLTRLGIHLRFTCYARIDDLIPPVTDLLSASGCVGLFIGLESPRLKNTSVSIDRSLKLISRLSERFSIMVSLIWGDPEESKADLEDTLALCGELLRLSEKVVVNLYQLAPLSGTFYAKYHRNDFYDSTAASEFVYPSYLPSLSKDEQTETLIRRYPEVFPAFYRIRTPDFYQKKSRVNEFLENSWTSYGTSLGLQGSAIL